MTSKRIINPAVWVALLPFAWLVNRFSWTCDDAFISFRYVQHLARGEGLTFNPGEVPPVEGFTNLLWILVLTPLHSLGVSLPVAATVISAACALALLVLLVQFLLRRGVSLWNAAACALIFVTLPPIGIWSTSGLETMPFTLAIFGTFMALALGKGKRRIALALVCALSATLLRADGALWCGFAFLAALLSESQDGADAAKGRAWRWKAVLATGVLLTVGVALHFLWRHSYFGEWMPNTAKIKAGFSWLRVERGLKYFASFALAAPAVVLIPFIALPFLGRIRTRASYGLGALAFLVLAASYTIFVGGDFMTMGRFLVPALPFLLLIFGATAEAVNKRVFVLLASTGLVALGLLGCFDRLMVPAGLRQALHFRWNGETARTEIEQWQFMGDEVRANAQLGRALALHTRPGETLIRGNVGAVGYYSELFLLDVNGLVIPDVAEASKPVERASPGHDRRVDASFFRSWGPDYQHAIVLPSGVAPRFGLHDRWKAMLNRGKLALERYPLREEDGFEPGTELRLLRDLRPAQEPEETDDEQ